MESRNLNKKNKRKAVTHIGQKLSLDWDTLQDDEKKISNIGSFSDAVTASRRNKNKVDTEYIAELTGLDQKEITKRFDESSLAFRDPKEYESDKDCRWLFKDEYLSGNIYKKLIEAKTAERKFRKKFENNIKALKEVMPAEVYTQPNIELGSPCVPPQMIDEFIYDSMQVGVKNKGKVVLEVPTAHNEITGKWTVVQCSDLKVKSVDAKYKYGTKRISSLKILKATLNGDRVAVYDTKTEIGPDGKEYSISVLNEADTLEALNKQEELRKDFKKWLWKDKRRADELMEIYRNEYLCVLPRQYDGDYLTEFPGMNPAITLRKSQKDAVARIIQSESATMINYSVGSGKTYIAISSAMELIRLGVIHKAMFVVPANIIQQWDTECKKLYPEIKLLTVTPVMMNPKRREKTLEMMKDGEYEAIIIGHNSFTSLKLAKKILLDMTKRETQEIIDEQTRTGIKDPAPLKKILKRREKIKDDTYIDKITFDELGIDKIYIDEAHLFKDRSLKETNGFCEAARSKRSEDMDSKLTYMRDKHSDSSIVLMTATPVTNSLTELYGLCRQLQPGTLKTLRIRSKRDWLAFFTEERPVLELDLTCNDFVARSRISKFHNLKALSLLLAENYATNKADENVKLPDLKEETLTVPVYPEFKEFMADLAERIEDIHRGEVDPTEDNFLKVTIDARTAAIDLRLLDSKTAANQITKLTVCADKAAEVYKATAPDKLTQAIFCDQGIPKPGRKFDVYNELKRLLIKRGVAPDDIAFVQDAASPKEKDKLFERVRNGDIRIIIGSSQLLGQGCNIQDRMIALYQISVPFQPSAISQMIGRMVRQNNINPVTTAYRIVQKSSFDAYSYQILERKARFIQALLTNTLTKTACEGQSDISDTALSYAEAKEIALSDPYVKKRIEIQNKIWKLEKLSEKNAGEIANLSRLLAEETDNADRLAKMIESAEADIQVAADSTKISDDEKKELVCDIIGTYTSRNASDTYRYRGFDFQFNSWSSKVTVRSDSGGEYEITYKLGEYPIEKMDRFISHIGQYKKKYEKELIGCEKKMKDLKALVDKAGKTKYDGEIKRLKKELSLIDSRYICESEEDE